MQLLLAAGTSLVSNGLNGARSGHCYRNIGSPTGSPHIHIADPGFAGLRPAKQQPYRSHDQPAAAAAAPAIGAQRSPSSKLGQRCAGRACSMADAELVVIW
jgi:hypothetical protein